MTNKLLIYFFAGEKSGDLHGGHLLKALKNSSINFVARGVGGPLLREHGLEAVMRSEDFEVMGFTDVLLSLPKLYKQFYAVLSDILNCRPDAVILIDYPGFNLRLAKALRKKGYTGKIVHYIAPSVWAHSTNRIEHMAQTLDQLLTIFPFEKKYFDNTNLNVSYVGNPLHEYISSYQYTENWQSSLNLPHSQSMIALFPGSRKGEIQRNLPCMLETAALLQKDHPELTFSISGDHPTLKAYANKLAHKLGLLNFCFVPYKYSYELMKDCRLALAKSGTVTLELALHKKPTVVIYNLTLLNMLYAKYVLKVNLPYYCIVNILKGQQVFPELIDRNVCPHKITHLTKQFFLENIHQECIQACDELKADLSTYKSSEKAAQLIQELICNTP